MQAAERWHRERLRAKAEAEAARRAASAHPVQHRRGSLDAILDAPDTDEAAGESDALAPRVQQQQQQQLPPPKHPPGRLTKRVSTVSHVIRERTKQALSPGAHADSSMMALAEEVGGEELAEEEEEEEEEDGASGTANDDDEAPSDSSSVLTPSDTPVVGRRRAVSEPTSPRSPAGARRVRCSLGNDRRMLLVPRLARFEEVLALARAKFGLEGGVTRLLCMDPAAAPGEVPDLDRTHQPWA